MVSVKLTAKTDHQMVQHAQDAFSVEHSFVLYRGWNKDFCALFRPSKHANPWVAQMVQYANSSRQIEYSLQIYDAMAAAGNPRVFFDVKIGGEEGELMFVPHN